MPGVFREIELAYNGETYTLVPSNRMLRRIESADVSILGTMARMATGAERGDIPIYDVAAIVCGFLKEAGATFSEDEVIADLMEDMQHNEAQGLIALWGTIVEAISPPEKAQKKAEPAPAKRKTKTA